LKDSVTSGHVPGGELRYPASSGSGGRLEQRPSIHPGTGLPFLSWCLWPVTVHAMAATNEVDGGATQDGDGVLGAEQRGMG